MKNQQRKLPEDIYVIPEHEIIEKVNLSMWESWFYSLFKMFNNILQKCTPSQVYTGKGCFMWTNSESTLTKRHVRPMTRTGFCADWDISNKLYNNVWFLWKINKSNSSNMNKIGRQSLFPIQ
jgi:hypothetical protein